MTASSPTVDRFPRTAPSFEIHDGPFAFISALVAGWLMCAPLVFQGDLHRQSNTLLVAAGIAAFAVMSLYSSRLRYANTILGAYLIGSSLVLALPETGRINAVACGAIVLACSLLRGRFARAWTPKKAKPA
jgi:hypothetical protein